MAQLKQSFLQKKISVIFFSLPINEKRVSLWYLLARNGWNILTSQTQTPCFDPCCVALFMSIRRMQFFSWELGGSSVFPNIKSSATQGQLMYQCSLAMFERLKTPIKIGPADNGISFVMLEWVLKVLIKCFRYQTICCSLILMNK